MTKLKAYGTIDLLLGLLITAAAAMLVMKTFYGTQPLNTITPEAVQEHVDKTVNEVEQLREQSINYNKQLLEQQNY